MSNPLDALVPLQRFLPPIFDGEQRPPGLGLNQAELRASQMRRRLFSMNSCTGDGDESSDSGLSTPTVTMNDETKPIPDVNSKQELVKLDPSEVGMSADYKHLYRGKEDRHGRFQWQTKIPEDVGKPAEDAESEKCAIIVRNVKVYNDPKRVLSIHSIVIQSPLLKDLLKEVLAGYPGITVGLKRLVFSDRFEPLIHRWANLKAAIDTLKSKRNGEDTEERLADRIEHAGLLHNLLAKEFKDTIDASTDLKSQGVMTYEYLWTLFQPGSFVFSRHQGQERIFRLHSSKYGQDREGNPMYWLTCFYVDYDGTSFGMNKLNIRIPAYEGTRSIANLAILPLEFHGDREQLKIRLIERGSKVEKLAGSHFRAYNGIGWRLNPMGGKDKYSVKGRVIIDTYGWNRFNPNMAVFVTPLQRDNNQTATGIGDLDGDSQYDEDDDGIPVDGSFADEDDARNKHIILTEEQKMICTPIIRGYALKEKVWLNLFVNAVHDIEFSDRAFDSLVLPKDQKELVLGFAATQQNHRSQVDDVIEGKGKGIIFLLCGPPGVGKTLTAESVAEQMKVPLYMMSAGDLGLEPKNVEFKLQGILDMCTRWNAILLLDEADVFLEERSLHELERNKLVSIFLRVLEYYEGSMFLTTNRVQTFDRAFQSRIHISLEYHELDAKSRKTVWHNFLRQYNAAQAAAREKPLKPLPAAAKAATNGNIQPIDAEASELHEKLTLPHAITEKEIVKLSQLNMNGRQIKNILKTAQLLASNRKQNLSYEHIETVMSVTQHLHNSTMENERTKASLFC